MKIKYNSEIISGAIFSIVGAILWVLIPTQIKTMEKSAINAQTLPKIAIGGMFIFAVGLLLEGIFAREKKELVVTKESFRSVGFKKEMRSILYALFLVAYCFMVQPLGFVVSTVILVLAIMLYYGARKWYYYAIPLAMVGIVYYVFRVMLHVSLP
ncbi:tripartite tricarboxylate transporter TctB family protein [uncultured Dysosmobacter sp.]|uniref:tripartite tricarboxylate transporter TctB family protein n=1 Tax=uncultured Dysosmobacter sp. TaxID=2591384 RepID=UPI00262DD780|nr:tripartite tricarboxylate transporter TctB family protein [uncultured Dysosmobacter sp.]